MMIIIKILYTTVRLPAGAVLMCEALTRCLTVRGACVCGGENGCH